MGGVDDLGICFFVKIKILEDKKKDNERGGSFGCDGDVDFLIDCVCFLF